MSIILPPHGLTVPSETTRFRDLGKELREFGTSVNDALESFDYNGVDPNLVLTRVAQLETQTAPLIGRYEGGGYYRARSTMTFASASWTVLSSTLDHWETVTEMGSGSWVSGARVPHSGLYRINLQLHVSSNIQLLAVIKRNNTAASKAGSVAGISVSGFAVEAFCNVSRDVRLVAGDVLTPAVYTTNTAGPYGVNPGEATVFSVEYIRP